MTPYHTFRTLTLLSGIVALTPSCTLSRNSSPLQADGFFKAVKQEEPAKPVRIMPVPQALPLPGQLKAIPKDKAVSAQNKPDRGTVRDTVHKAQDRAKIEPAPDGFINAIQIYPFTPGALYRLYGAVNRISDIALQQGEQLQSVSAGDTVRWIVGDTASGSGANRQVHILVKPSAPKLQTNLVITTDRRTYHLELVSDENTYMASVSWDYPHDDLIALRAQNTTASVIEKATVSGAIDLSRLNFGYEIQGDSPWKPVRVFDDGTKVFIQFPAGLGRGEAPPLFIRGSNDKPALVNYRLKHPYYVVDRLFSAAELRHGETPQTIVRIRRSERLRNREDQE